jgi:hypothetical protein
MTVEDLLRDSRWVHGLARQLVRGEADDVAREV